jgi:hypothetical protein
MRTTLEYLQGRHRHSWSVISGLVKRDKRSVFLWVLAAFIFWFSVDDNELSSECMHWVLYTIIIQAFSMMMSSSLEIGE